MALTNNLKKIVDLPIFELCNQAPTATSAVSGTTTTDASDGRYIYYLVGALFYRYDCQADMWQQLASPNITPATAVALKYTTYNGYRGNILAGSASGATIGGMGGYRLAGQRIRITNGTGIGQERTILSVQTTGDTLDMGLATTASANLLTDTTKRWEINQFIGYQVRLVYGTGASQVRRILHNDSNTLYFYDPNYQQLDPWNNTPFSAIAPYAAPVATAGLQANFYIEGQTIVVDSPWTVQPDDSSSFCILGGGVWLASAFATAPFMSWQYYDVLSDAWITKTAIGGLLTAALGTDFSIERTGEVGTPFVSSTATSAGARTLTDTVQTMTDNFYVNYELRITGGTGIGQKQRIVSNSATRFEVAKPWDIIPSTDSTYVVYGNTDIVYLVGNGASTMYQYHVENDYWTISEAIDDGQCRNMSVAYPAQEAFAMTSGVRNTGGITALNATPTAGGTGYAIGDLFNITTGGTVGKGRVEAISAGGVVTVVSLYSSGLTYTTGASKATTIISGSGNNGLTVNITSVGTVGRITVASNCNLYNADPVTIKGCTDAAWNTTYNILAIDSLTTFDIIITAAGNAAATASQTTSIIVDATKTWTIDEHVGKIVTLSIAGQAPTTQQRRITANTATTLTMATIVAGANGTSRYCISNPEAFGRAEQWEQFDKRNVGFATGGSSTTLVDSTKNWYVNQWAGYKFRVYAGTGVGAEVTITSNTATTLTYTAPGFTVDTTTKYIIMDSFGLATAVTNTTNATITDSTKNWKVNQWAGRRLRITAGTGIGQEIAITSNTATVITCTGVFTTAPDTTSCYTIFSIPARSTGIQINWIYNNTGYRGRWLFSTRGGGTNVNDAFIINESLWTYTALLNPQTETVNTGTMTAYDGANKMYLQKDATGRIFQVDVNTISVDGAFQLTDLHGAAVLGNRMEIMNTTDGLKYLYIMQHTGTKMWRALIF